MKRAERRRRVRAEDRSTGDRYPWLGWAALVVVALLCLFGAWVIVGDRMPPCSGGRGSPSPCPGGTRSYP